MLEAGGNQSILSMILSSGPVVQSVLILLIVLSIWSWAITISKVLQFKKAKADSEKFVKLFWDSRNLARIDDATRRLKQSPLTHVFSAGYKELSQVLEEEGDDNGAGLKMLGSVERALKRAEVEAALRLDRGNTFLASVASAAPFIGLFGTVWGIMNAFLGLSQLQSTTLQAVAPGISEALVATAVGLAAAIPAAVAYNYFAVGVKQFRESMDTFSAEFLNVAQRYIIK
jgi:biopolymer transport protein TolQ